MTKFVQMQHSWQWLAPADIADAEGFVLAYNDAVDPYGINLEQRISVDEFAPDDEYDPSEFTMWAEHVWHIAESKSQAKYATEEGAKRWLDLLRVFGELLIDGPDINGPYREYELNPDATAPASDD